jgi:catechol 2,3-dioxygenase-like lactoylglutathione lyase family enzyme
MRGFSLDHVGFMVRDLDAGAALWARLGFRLSPRSPQMGRVPGQLAMAPWATANHCAMFQRGYLELIGVVQADNFNPWDAFLDRFEGIHIIAFRCDDADAAYAVLTARIGGFDPPLQRQRNAPFDGGTRLFRFRNVFSQDDRFPEGRFIVIEHQTPEVIWQDALMTHSNGAVAIEEVVFCADPPASTRRRLAGIIGVAANQGRFDLPGGGSTTVLDRAAFKARFPGAALPRSLPAAAAVVIGVADLARTLAVLRAAGIDVQAAKSATIWVPADAANGAVIAFTQAPRTGPRQC